MDARTLALALAVVVASAPGAAAHEATARHGGRIADAEPYHVELVGRGGTVDLYLSDEGGAAVPAAGFAGTAILVVGGRPARIPLAPAEGNRLTGPAPIPVEGPTRGAVTITAPDGRSASARFD